MSQTHKGIFTLSRRRFFKAGGTAAAALCANTAVSTTTEAARKPLDPREVQEAAATRRSPDARTVHSVCLACNARCGVRGVVRKGRLVNISGNPYHPYNMQFDPIAYDTPLEQSLAVTSPVCGKALDTPQHIYSPYRLRVPLKRSGPRGSGQFEPIAWPDLIREIAEGGTLFSHLGEDRHVPGIRELISDDPIDPQDPDLGPKRNGLVFLTGRLQSGRKEFIDRFVKKSVGSKNRIGHTDICGLGFRMGNFALSDGKAVELKADPKNADYILVFGANIYEALQPGINTYGAMVARRRADGELAFSIVDPRATRASVHARDWLAVKPGQDGALAMAMIRRMIETGRINRDYLGAPNPIAVKKRGYGALCNASHLVICDGRHPDDGAFLRMHHLNPNLDEAAGNDRVIFARDGKTPVASLSAAEAALDREAAVKDVAGKTLRVKTAYRLLKEAAFAHSLADYAAICGVDRSLIERVADEFASHGTRAAVTQYHGAGNYVNGTYAAYAIAALNALVGSVNMKGGYLTGGGGCGKPTGGLYDLKSFPGGVKARGVAISREKAVYEKSAEYRRKRAQGGSGYPSRRPWFAFTRGGLCVEALSGIDEQYPYAAKVLFTYLFNPVYSIPGGYRFASTLADPAKVPLHVSIDIAVNESNLYADYIVPDLSFAEGHYGWLTPHAPGLCFTGIRSPMVKPLTDATPDGRPICTETLLIDLATRLQLPGFGHAAIPDAGGGRHDLSRAEDFYLRAFANIADGAKITPAGEGEIATVEAEYPISAHRGILPDEQWRRVCRMLARGGVFKPYDALFEGDIFIKGLPEVHLYNESLARSRNTLTGRRFSGTPAYVVPADAGGNDFSELENVYPFTVVTYKTRLHTQSRSLWSVHAMEIQDENRVEMNSADCRQLGLVTGDRVRLASVSNPAGITGRVQATKLVRPGCVAVSFHFGHSGFGAGPLTVKNGADVFLGGAAVIGKDGRLVVEPGFAKGLNPNDVALLDERLGRTPMVDLVGGIPDFSSTRVRIEKMISKVA
ncbi:molybdopterin dinucleotide binding domain-containing protein [Desulfosarcina ovata]|uniref:Tetrathionate reductase subunit A n=1 Tax=Desulfosarcina ovata subsp. ovata TaxID=2752305 RepID=A0A5K8AK15_9BACT|nr:molybdopterin dinucleotide binding domain-containing protein [Desulfosarcina ovata]BBO92004.1 tetrathionate reductase subunit A [Desulfosarcina ovata subsp. ovata]